MVDIFLPSTTGDNRSKLFQATKLLNLYPEVAQSQDARSVFALQSCPGFKTLKDASLLATTPCRGVLEVSGKLYTVYGNSLYVFNDEYTYTEYAGVRGNATVDMAANNTGELIIVADNQTFLFDVPTTTLSQITDAAFSRANSVVFHNGYFLFTKKDSKEWFRSDLNDATTYNALWYGAAEADRDNLVKVFANNDIVYLFGTESIELHRNTAAGDFGYQPIVGATIDVGCAARDTVRRVGNTVMWLGSDRLFYTMTGGQQQIISTNEIAYTVYSMARVDDAVAWTYTQGLHKFYCVTFRDEGRCLVYDLAAERWHERASFGQRHYRGAFGTTFNKQVVVPDAFNLKLHALDLDIFTEEDGPFIRQFTLPSIHATVDAVAIDRLEFIMETGAGTATGIGQNPQVILEYSDDGARTWQPAGQTPLGKIGEYQTRVVFYSLGQTPLGRNFRVTIAEPVKVVVISAHAKVQTRPV
jgi:hypothetical protein